LFDLGNISKLASSDLIKASHVFVSHTHIDHFIGFDQLLRVNFGREKTIRLYGPENFIQNVEGKLAGFTWNLVERYDESLTLEVAEVLPGRIKRATFKAIEKFQRSDEREENFAESEPLLEESTLAVYTVILEHRVPCLGFALKENKHLNIRKDQLEARRFVPGRWLNDLKKMVAENAPEDSMLSVPVGDPKEFETISFPFGELKEELVLISPGQKIAYITDTVFQDGNNEKIVELVKDADKFFCESPFIAEEAERGKERRHLTSQQAGTLARRAKVKKLIPFHFSPKHFKRKAQLYREAEEAFSGVVS
jgi:ribonuclease Z